MHSSVQPLQSWHLGVRLNGRWPTRLGLFVLVACVAGFGAWAGLAPLEGAVVASGSFVATGQNKQIQHFEGGILRDSLVTEGQIVEAGQTLMRLDDTAPTAKLRRLLLKRYRLLATCARLEAEIDDKPALAVPKALAALADDPEVTAMLTRQRVELEAKQAKLASEQEVLRKEIKGLMQSISGFEARAKSARDRASLFQEELKDKSSLLDRQLTRKSDVLALQRAEAGITGELGEVTGRIADSRERIARAEQQIESLRSAAIQRSITELREAETELDDVEEQIHAAQDVVARLEVRAPVRGAVVRINQHTSGGVIAPGAVILELLPLNDELVIEARVRPEQITHVHEGQPALVRLSALNQRSTPMIEGNVVYLSVDTVAEAEQPASRQARAADRSHSFVVRVRLDAGDMRAKTPDFRPTPGMPADVFIKTAERTFFDYIITPVRDSFARAFREE
jgi:HlyD family type I secretion membrane fusion protein